MWSTKPQPVDESRWRFPLASDMPAGDIVCVGGDLTVDSDKCLPPWHLPHGSERAAGRAGLVVAGSTWHPAA